MLVAAQVKAVDRNVKLVLVRFARVRLRLTLGVRRATPLRTPESLALRWNAALASLASNSQANTPITTKKGSETNRSGVD